MTKLNLGCGERHIDGYINIDFKKSPAVDRVLDINNLDKEYHEYSLDVIYASHVIEHFKRDNGNNILKQIYKVLKPSGIFRIAVPDWDAVVDRYKDTYDLEELMRIIYGRPDAFGEGHYTIWTYGTLEKDLKDIGFRDVWEYDWRTTEHSYMDDFSRAHLPHDVEAIRTGKFDNHRLMSLNMEAVK